MLKVRFLRPFFEKELRALLQEKKQIIILDRNYSFGKGGVFADEIRSVLYGMNIPFQPVVAGLGGRDITTKTVETIIENSLKREGNEIYWEGEVYV
jgi:pyruvate/2-oxoacid:ferredoxin oxidoreductase alpha subunit